MILTTISSVLAIEGYLLLLPLTVALLARDWAAVWGLGVATALALCLGIPSTYLRKNVLKRPLQMSDGCIISVLSWLALSLVGALPFVLSGRIPHFIDAFFETVSGFTTTGSSILGPATQTVESLGFPLLFWRSLTHFVGGMGVLVLTISLVPIGNNAYSILSAEMPGPSFSRVASRLQQSSRGLYVIYASLTGLLILILRLCGMSWGDALIHALSSAGTGGFSSHSSSVAYFQSPLIELVLGIAVLVFSVNMNLYYLTLFYDRRVLLESEETKSFLAIVGLTSLGIGINLFASGTYANFWTALRHGFFNVSSLVSTTGYGTENYVEWPLFSQILLLLMMFFGGCAGSTAGGLKISRVLILFKEAFRELLEAFHPKRLFLIHQEGQKVSRNETRNIVAYFLIYVLLFGVLLIAFSFFEDDFTTAFGAIATTFNNVGPGLGKIGPWENMGSYGPIPKLILIFSMLAGRLEILPILVACNPHIWARTRAHIRHARLLDEFKKSSRGQM